VDTDNFEVEKVTPGGTLSIVAGTGSQGAPTPGPATSSDLNYPDAVAVDPSGDLFIADNNNAVIEKVTPDGTLSIFAGTGTQGPAVPGPATSSSMGDVTALATDSAGDLFIADDYNSQIEKVTPSGTLSIIAGDGSYGTETPGPALSSMLANPDGMTVDSAGDVYLADNNNNVVEEITPSGTLSIDAGTGNSGAPTAGPALSSDLNEPSGVALNPAGTFYYLADYGNGRVEKVVLADPTPVATTPPTISGTPAVGTTLLASHGSWSNAPTSYAYQWQLCDAGGGNCTDISGATSSSYTVIAADAGQTLRVVVSAQGGGGTVSADSAVTAVVFTPTATASPTTPASPTTTVSPTTPASPTTTASPSAGGVGLSADALSAGVVASAGGGLQLPLVCQHAATACDADGTLTLILSSSHGRTPVEDSVLARFTGVEIQTGQSRLVSVTLTPAATGYLQTRGIRRVRVQLTIHNHLTGGQDVTTRQRVWLNIAALRASCPAAVGTITGSSVAKMRLGLTRRQAHRLGRYRKAHYGFDRYCLTGGAIRVAYTTRSLLHLNPTITGQRTGRVDLALTANHHYKTHGIQTRMTVAKARTRLHLGHGIVIGKNTWYFAAERHATTVIKAQAGVVREIGVANPKLTHTRAQQRILLRHL
jgi:hypothetical protein